MKTRIVYIITTAFSANVLLRGQLAFLRQSGFEIFLLCSPGDDIQTVKEREQINIRPIHFNREISLIADLRALIKIVRVLKEIKPDLVNCSTPKAGLLGSLAGWIVGVRVIIYTLRGLRLETTSGFKRLVLSVCEWVASACAHEVICVSNSLKMRYTGLGLAPAEKIIVLGDGSSNGVDIERFRPCGEMRQCEDKLRETLKLPKEARVLGFVGRIGRDKGLDELLKAFSLVCKEVPDVFLVLVGGIETEGGAADKNVKILSEHEKIRITGFVKDTAPYYSIFDLVILPTFREGFPNVVLEAGAASLPVVAFAGTGVCDAVVDGITGRLVPVGDFEGLAGATIRYLKDPQLMEKHGKNGARRVQEFFNRERIWKLLVSEYERMLKGKSGG